MALSMPLPYITPPKHMAHIISQMVFIMPPIPLVATNSLSRSLPVSIEVLVVADTIIALIVVRIDAISVCAILRIISGWKMTIASAAVKAEQNSVIIAGRRREISTPVMIGTANNHGVILYVLSNACSMRAVSAVAVVEADKPMNKNTIMAISIDGVVVISIYLICVNSGTSEVEEANTVVSLIIDILSPKYAPEIIAPAIQPSSKPNARPIPIKATPMVAMVVHEEPVSSDIMAQIMHDAGRKIDG